MARGLFGVRPTAASGSPSPTRKWGQQFGTKPPFSTVASIPSYLLQRLFPSPSIRHGLRFLLPGGRGGLHVHFSLREGRMGWTAPTVKDWYLTYWYFRSSRHQVDKNVGAIFFPTSTASSLRRGLRPNRHMSIQQHRPCSLRWTGRRPTCMCTCPPSRKLSLHICALCQPKPWARISAYHPNHAG